MTNQVHVQRDLMKVLSVMVIIAALLAGLKMYDAKTNNIGKIGEQLLSKYVN